jgi:hypothetical protein
VNTALQDSHGSRFAQQSPHALNLHVSTELMHDCRSQPSRLQPSHFPFTPACSFIETVAELIIACNGNDLCRLSGGPWLTHEQRLIDVCETPVVLINE